MRQRWMTRTTRRSNRESGLGRFDIALESRVAGLPGTIIEVKNAQDDKFAQDQMENLARKAVAQVTERSYGTGMKAHGVIDLTGVGVAFSGKCVAVARQRLVQRECLSASAPRSNVRSEAPGVGGRSPPRHGREQGRRGQPRCRGCRRTHPHTGRPASNVARIVIPVAPWKRHPRKPSRAQSESASPALSGQTWKRLLLERRYARGTHGRDLCVPRMKPN